mgnify:CR=1 FL=1
MTSLKNQLQNKANNTNQVKKASPSKGMEQLLTKMGGQIQKALPSMVRLLMLLFGIFHY